MIFFSFLLRCGSSRVIVHYIEIKILKRVSNKDYAYFVITLLKHALAISHNLAHVMAVLMYGGFSAQCAEWHIQFECKSQVVNQHTPLPQHDITTRY